MKSVDVVISFLLTDGVEAAHPVEVMVFEERADALFYLEHHAQAETTNNAYWDKNLIGTMVVRYWLRSSIVKESTRNPEYWGPG